MANINKNKIRRRIIAFSIAIIALTTYYSVDETYHPSYEITAEKPEGPFGSYSFGNIYIGTSRYLNSLANLSPNDILVEDRRYSKDPNMIIYSSYRITDKELRNEILEVLCEYEKCYPSPWERSIESMRLEWFVHNISYYFNHEPYRSGNVDLDNNEEDLYNQPVLNKILKI